MMDITEAQAREAERRQVADSISVHSSASGGGPNEGRCSMDEDALT